MRFALYVIIADICIGSFHPRQQRKRVMFQNTPNNELAAHLTDARPLK